MHTERLVRSKFFKLRQCCDWKSERGLVEKLRRDQDGSQLVEFALCYSVWSLAAFAVLYTGFLFYADHFVSSAAKNAARYASVRGSTWNGVACSNVSSSSCTATASNVTSYVQATIFPGMSANQLTVLTTWPGTTPSGASCDTVSGADSPNCGVSIQVGYSFSFPMPFFPRKQIPLKATSEMTILE